MQKTTTQGLPTPIAGYFTHEASDPRALAQCFTEDALVIDEREERRGRGAIEAWNRAVTAKIAFTTQVLTVETEGDDTLVRATVSGSFPGSPVELRFRFTLEGDLISRLEIAP
ncbi:MAG: nuclear transport factor 2 family protein [Polyangiaceae bacterium]|nr:nuclear transport factor 2 family protein [Polyangiaceae bacterium]